MEFFTECEFGDRKIGELMEEPLLNPLKFKNQFKNFPDTLIVTAGKDPLCDDGKILKNLLSKQNVNVKLKNYPEEVHGFFTLSVCYEYKNVFNYILNYINNQNLEVKVV